MRVAVVGATGNAGTAVLAALKENPEVTGIVGVARRLPDTRSEPYADCDWVSIDIAAASTAEDAAVHLTRAFAGVDAVIHLSWLIQPNTRRELLRRVNVEGTRRVVEAAATAGVPTLVVASSVGAYSPDGGGPLRDESWPTEGIQSSHYSTDKAAQERVLDLFADEHPEIAVTRLRPALVFQAAAGSEIQRYFLGDRFPIQVLGTARPPVLPLPRGLRVQAVHAKDLGRAYAAAAVAGRPGAYNICADDVLTAKDLAELVDHGRFVELPPKLVRAVLAAAYTARVVPTDPGWLDMAMLAPQMDNARARTELGWQPRFTAAEALTELLAGMVEGQGAASPPMRPRDEDRATVSATHEPAGRGAASGKGRPARGPLPTVVSADLLNLYLSDHLTGATAGAERASRMAADFIDTPVFADLSWLAEEIRADRTLLRQLLHDLGLRQRRHRQALAWAGERVGRLKANGAVLSRSPVTLVLETELMRSAVAGKLGVWETLKDNADVLRLDPEVFSSLIDSSHAQLARLERVHTYARHRAFREDRETFTPANPDTD